MTTFIIGGIAGLITWLIHEALIERGHSWLAWAVVYIGATLAIVIANTIDE